MRVFSGLLAAAVAILAIAFLARDLVPPKSVTLAAGAPGGGYAAIAERYASILRRDGIEAVILETAGSVENARLLGEGLADVALLQGGIDAPEGSEALGAIFYEPLFVFVRRDGAVPSNAGEWVGLRIAAGGEGSGTRAATLALFRAAGTAPGANTLLAVGGAAAAEALIGGEAEAAVFVAPLAAPYLDPLFDDDEIELLTLDYLPALSRNLRHADVVTLEAGARSIVPPVPAEPVPLIAMIARLVAVEGLHPSLVDRLVTAAVEVHGDADQITDARAFPTTDGVAAPLDIYARDLITKGPSPLQDILPYWMVAQINRFAILLLPILFLLLPLIRSLPGLYQWRVRSSVYRHYREILDIDTEAMTIVDPERAEALSRELDRIEEKIIRLKLPMHYRHLAYTARLHIDLVRTRLASVGA